MRGLFFRQMGALRPADEAAEAILSRCKDGELVAVDVKRGRNLAHHRKLFKLFQIVADNQTHYIDADQILVAFKFAVGWTDKIKTKRGVVEIPRSISFAKCDQDEFNIFYDKAVNYLCTEVIPGMDGDALKREVDELLAPRQAGPERRDR